MTEHTPAQMAANYVANVAERMQRALDYGLDVTGPRTCAVAGCTEHTHGADDALPDTERWVLGSVCSDEECPLDHLRDDVAGRWHHLGAEPLTDEQRARLTRLLDGLANRAEQVAAGVARALGEDPVPRDDWDAWPVAI